MTELRCKLSDFSLIALLALAICLGNAANANTRSDEKLYFRVFLENKEIGYHRVQLSRTPTGTDVSVEASFDIKVLFFNAFSYRHSAEERWDGTCLQAVSSETDYGGDQLFLRSEKGKSGLKLINQNREVTLPGCVRSYAYWDLDRLRAKRLLNTQTGEYQQAEITYAGVKPLQIGARNLVADCYQLKTEQGTISLWYGEDDRWLGLQTLVKGNRVLSYISEPTNVDT